MLLTPVPARVVTVSGPLSGSWKLTVHYKTFFDDGSKPVIKTTIDDAVITDDSTGLSSNATITVTPSNGDPQFVLSGKRVGTAFRVVSDPLAASDMTLAGEAVINKKTAFAVSASGAGSTSAAGKIGLRTFTGKRTGP